MKFICPNGFASPNADNISIVWIVHLARWLSFKAKPWRISIFQKNIYITIEANGKIFNISILLQMLDPQGYNLSEIKQNLKEIIQRNCTLFYELIKYLHFLDNPLLKKNGKISWNRFGILRKINLHFRKNLNLLNSNIWFYFKKFKFEILPWMKIEKKKILK